MMISNAISGSNHRIEPIPANIFVHKTLEGSTIIKNPRLEALLESKGMNNKEVWDTINDHADSPAGSVQHLTFLTQDEKDCFKTAFEIKQGSIIDLARERSVYIDQASSTNLIGLYGLAGHLSYCR